VIVGGGFGGLNAAKALRDAPVRLTLVDKRNYHLFQPLLYQVATASLSPADIATPIRTVLRDQQNATVLLAEVRNVDLDRREVVMDDETLTYDYLILSAGAETNYFGKQEWDDLAPGLKSIEDAIEIRNRVFAAFELAERTDDEAERKRLLTFLVVGGGSTGVELAGALGEIAHFTLQREFRRIDPSRARIILAHSRDRVLDTFPERLSRFAETELMRLGVEIRTGVRVTGIAPGAAWLGDQRIEAGTILWAAGVRASDLTRSPGLPIDRSQRVLVQPDLSIPGHPEAFAIGDMAAMSDRYGGPLPGVAPVAIQEATAAVANIQRRMRGEPTQRFTYHDRGVLATIGRNRAVAVIRGICLDGFFAWLVWAFVHIYTLIGFRNRIAVMSQWIWAYVTRQRSARLITELHRAPVVDVLIHRTEPRATSVADREQAHPPAYARSAPRE
jgi:NADH dehydrogenase